MTSIVEPPAFARIRDAYTEIDQLYDRVTRGSEERYRSWAPGIARLSARPSARNLAAYLSFRDRDLRDLQDRLVPLGLSSLGRCEAHVQPSIQAVRATLAALCGEGETAAQRPRLRHFLLGARLLERNTRAIFGAASGAIRPHIMVTLATQAATDYNLVRRLVHAGMDSARINCAHDDADMWSSMAANVRRASAETGRPCRIYMDIAGPKVRVGSIVTHHPQKRYVIGDTVKITCTEPIVYEHLKPGAPAWIDDGKIGAVVVRSDRDGIKLTITYAEPKGSKIRAGKGLNFPQTSVPLPPLGKKDLADLDRIVLDADIVGQSFVRTAADVRCLINELSVRGARLPVVAKIETAEAITNLPDIIVAGASTVPFGIMIARGDLAIEIGYERLAEIQEELLWVCEAAHVPVIWATQVLEHFVRDGMPSRAEITDAAMSERADCVMLNKGPFVVDAVVILRDVLTRMQGHQAKKSPRLRALRSWSNR